MVAGDVGRVKLDRTGGIGEVDVVSWEGFGESLLESTGFGMEERSRLGVAY